MKAVQAIALAAAVLSTHALASGDPVTGERKAAVCMTCHGSASFPGVFPLVQLGGRDADKIATKTNKYRSGKLISPMMNLAVMSMNDQDVADVSAYYQKLGKPFLAMSGIRGDEDLQASAQ
jgi:cytochrome c553